MDDQEMIRIEMDIDAVLGFLFECAAMVAMIAAIAFFTVLIWG